MNHKRKRPKNRRAGCLLCKPWKMNGASQNAEHKTRQEMRAEAAEREGRDEFDT